MPTKIDKSILTKIEAVNDNFKQLPDENILSIIDMLIDNPEYYATSMPMIMFLAFDNLARVVDDIYIQHGSVNIIMHAIRYDSKVLFDYCLKNRLNLDYHRNGYDNYNSAFKMALLSANPYYFKCLLDSPAQKVIYVHNNETGCEDVIDMEFAISNLHNNEVRAIKMAIWQQYLLNKDISQESSSFKKDNKL